MSITDLHKHTIAILGFGQEGQAVAQYLHSKGITCSIFDAAETSSFDADQQALLSTLAGPHYCGKDYLAHLQNCDIIFRSPGIPSDIPELIHAIAQGSTVTSQTRWFFDHCPAPIIGITGTKGKGTTTTLIHHILQTALSNGQVATGKLLHPDTKLYLTGNIGKTQPFEFLERLTPHDIVIYELSSFQLEDLHKSPHIGVCLMVTTDHLDHHHTVATYHAAKEAIVAYQNETDIAIINADFPASVAIGQKSEGQKLWFSRKQAVSHGATSDNKHTITITGLGDQPIAFDTSSVHLTGTHNQENLCAAILASLSAGATPEAIAAALPSYVGLPHRLELVATTDGITFYDDSISTVPDTAMAAITAFAPKPVIAILGGSDKGHSYVELAEFVTKSDHVKAVLLLGAVAPAIQTALNAAGFAKSVIVEQSDFSHGIKQLKAIATAGDIVLLSPGAASFGMFKNYSDRGEQFKMLAKQWGTL
jgi:UDP-N-acetylmuramoylalanine--D-glutamate ligase